MRKYLYLVVIVVAVASCVIMHFVLQVFRDLVEQKLWQYTIHNNNFSNCYGNGNVADVVVQLTMNMYFIMQSLFLFFFRLQWDSKTT